jgi:hypothetical protein
MILPGSQLEELCSQAHDEVVLVAPFIKAPALARLLSKVPKEVKVMCVTRWRPQEIITGVSDLEVWMLVSKLPHASLWLRPDLHAKYYRADQECLVGSANITATALGWLSQTNLELLVPLPAANAQLLAFEKELFAGSIQVSQSIFEQMQWAVQSIEEQCLEVRPPEILLEPDPEEASQETIATNAWLPTLRNPEDLYLAYSGRFEELSTASRETALLDLRSLPLPPNLPKPAFQIYVGSLLLQKPIVYHVDLLLASPQRFGAVTDLLSSLQCSQALAFDADRAWQTLMRWLRYFLPNRYTLSVPNHSEVFGRIKLDS